MDLIHFFVKAGIYLLAFIVTWYAMSCINYEKLLRKGHAVQAQVFYILLVMAVAYLAGSFILVFIN